MPDPGTPFSRFTIIGRVPGQGAGHYFRLKRPQFTRSLKDWDTCEETLWVNSLDHEDFNQGTERSADLRAAGYLGSTGRFWVTDYTQIGEKAGKPIIRLMLKGWQKTKLEHWSGRRSISGDAQNMNLGGFSYATRVSFLFNTAPTLAIGVLAGGGAPNSNFGLGGVIAPTYATTWPYWFTGATPGWFFSNREIDLLPGTAFAIKYTDTWSRLMKNDGTNGV